MEVNREVSMIEGMMDLVTRPAGTEVNQEASVIEAHCKQLLPGIPDDFTLGEIAPKLPWKKLVLATIRESILASGNAKL